jgi:hypothetical protein
MPAGILPVVDPVFHQRARAPVLLDPVPMPLAGIGARMSRLLLAEAI